MRQSSVGLYLGDGSGEEVLLPKKYCPEEIKPGDDIEVFVYRDSEARKTATTLNPGILLNQFALLQVTAVSDVGAFMDWGLEKDLMVPFREQRQKMEEGRWYIVYLDLDQKSDRLFASNKVEKFLQNDNLSVKAGEGVSLIVLQKTDLGFSVIINHVHIGLIFENEIFREIRIGDELKGYVKKIREDNKIDISISPIGHRNSSEANSELIYNKLLDAQGFLAISDSSTPDEIYSMFGISKKAFKKSIGALYKRHKISIQPDGIRVIKKSSDS